MSEPDSTKPAKTKGAKRKYSWKNKGGRPPRPTPAEMDSITLARALGRSSLGKAVQRLLEAMDAEKVEFVKDEGGFVPVGEIPDHAIRIRAANEFLDRFGMPRRTEVDSGDQVSLLLSALAAAAKDRAGDT